MIKKSSLVLILLLITSVSGSMKNEPRDLTKINDFATGYFSWPDGLFLRVDISGPDYDVFAGYHDYEILIEILDIGEEVVSLYDMTVYLNFEGLSGGDFGAEFGSAATSGDIASIHTVLTGTAITASTDGFRTRLVNIEFNNTTELNSTIYFCRASSNEFNYSSNPTYLSGSKIRVKNTSADAPSAYITTIGLYSEDNELLAVAKISEPLKKDPTNELTLRVRLDY